jgi:ferritin-like metal-binding protein YciE
MKKKETDMKATKTSQKSKGAAEGTDELRSKLGKLFENELKDIYWAEQALTKAIPKMIKKATSQELIDALETHLAETEEHVKRAEQVFSIIGSKAVAKKCEAMAGLIEEAEELMEDNDEGVMRDAAIISAGQKVEHYEIASYGTLRAFAETLGLTEAVSILEETLEEEKNADETLTEVAVSAVNLEAASEPEE